MECKYCGAKLRDGANFCPKCGREINPFGTGVALSSGQDPSQKRKKGCLIAGIAGAVILAAAAAAIVFLWKSGLPDSLSALPSAQQEAETEERKPEEDFLEDEAAAESVEESWEEAADGSGTGISVSGSAGVHAVYGRAAEDAACQSGEEPDYGRSVRSG